MKSSRLFPLSFLFAWFAVSACAGDAGTGEDVGSQQSAVFTGVRVPGLVLGLQHNQNHDAAGAVMYSALESEAKLRRGGDRGASRHRGFEWWSLDDVGGDPAALRLPPGVVVALKHSANQSSVALTAFGRNPVSGADFPGFKRQVGGDLGAPNGVGYYWYESTGAGFTDWSGVTALLPKYTVVGLKHAANQPNKVLVWNNVTFDPAKSSASPPGFRRVVGGDIGAPAGKGYYWFEKTTGEEIVTMPTLTTSLPASLKMGSTNTSTDDKDQDCLVDAMEAKLASTFRPHVTFDSDEDARRDDEPVTVFRLYPTSATTVHVRWVFLFAFDGGYGEESSCFDGHEGDNDTADYDLTTSDAGVTWRVTKIDVSFKGLKWRANGTAAGDCSGPAAGCGRLEVFDKTHPRFYFSGSKHHEYLNRDNDEFVSKYSKFSCEDDVNGTGDQVLVNDQSFPGLASNNVGEPWAHAGFVDDLPMYPFPNPQNHHQMWNTFNGSPDCFVVITSIFNPPSCGTNVSKIDGTDQAPPIPPAVTACAAPTLAAGFVWAQASTGSFSADANYSYNSAGSTNTITQLDTGSYRVDFPGLGKEPGGNVQVTAYGAGSERCKVGSWSISGGTLSATVRCFSSAGSPVNTLFTASYLRRPGTTTALNGGYLWTDQPSAASYTPTAFYQWNSTGAENTVQRNGVGSYTATFPGITLSGGTVEVTAYGSGSEHCKVVNWGTNIVNVSCFTAAGSPVDTMFTLNVADKSPQGTPSYAYAWAEQPTSPSYTPYFFYQTNFRSCASQAPVTMIRTSTGRYTATIPGLAPTGSNVKVTAYSGTSESCKVVNWFGASETQVNIACHDALGQPVDSLFVLVYSSLDTSGC